ncbi:cobalamin biosynthesis protein CobD/CbiB [Ameyamaea chiangmaiensis NBRC 103196]|uniref:adenosylcobinamide-phosphate synthase CbiB n=1 Tax=Ameyamaea chiangmaiensis TaxID=442969 RepID=UPI001BAF1698|nr:adenosylcobinamide-phosphate synthase CbiB [Ameyamaea chiangmaiensis]MBS4076266.1 cobalamin biosynthesis protein CobD [Ameyamaea chiangmaiensis]GBQ64760.1 cobalamin biosynthesis protein CobD/CbiB [Ameyamaea chiangmaiensis NBRC 103196]
MTVSFSSCSLPVAALGAATDALFGYPAWLFARIGHPVTWIGAMIAQADTRFNRTRDSARIRRLAGAVTLVVLLAVWVAFAWAVSAVILTTLRGIGVAVLGLLTGTLIAQRSLEAHVRAVRDGLNDGGLDGGRAAVAHIVGRNPATLDEAGVVRAAIESLAENFSDGVVAPLFWASFAGLPGAVGYKVANTADSMIGHRTTRHDAFGWAAARFDDLVNLPASRLSALWITLAAALTRGASARGAVRTVWRDASRHRSPNAGWPEAAMAGALGVRLAGPRIYGATRVDDHWMGEGRADATTDDLTRALMLYRRACVCQGVVLAVVVITMKALRR